MSEEETILEAELYESENVIGLAKPRAIGPFSSVQVAASALVVLLLASTILYNFMSSEEVLPVYQQESSVVDNTVFVTDSSGTVSYTHLTLPTMIRV